MKRRNFPVPIDRSGKLSEPFLQGKRDRDAGAHRSSSRGQNVTWKDLSPDMWRRGSKSSEEDRERRKVSSNRRQSRDDGLPDRDPERDSGGGSRSDRRREKDRERERDREPARPRLAKRHSSYEGDTRWDRDRERDLNMRSPELRNINFRERDRERRPASPTRGVDGRYYPTVR